MIKRITTKDLKIDLNMNSKKFLKELFKLSNRDEIENHLSKFLNLEILKVFPKSLSVPVDANLTVHQFGDGDSPALTLTSNLFEEKQARKIKGGSKNYEKHLYVALKKADNFDDFYNNLLNSSVKIINETIADFNDKLRGFYLTWYKANKKDRKGLFFFQRYFFAIFSKFFNV